MRKLNYKEGTTNKSLEGFTNPLLTNYEGKKMIDNAVTLRFTRGAGNKFKTPEMNYFSKAGGIQIRPVHK